ncbi:MAG: DUF2442 domain-containing protein [Treponema sp.]|nr:DUF2442 domain-containing protein [Treponema sp.]
MEMIKGEKLSPRVLEVFPLENYILKLKFNNDEIRFFDAKKIYDLPCFQPLKQKEFFNAVHVELGSVAWANDIDYCPDTLYEESYIE